jgi:hypothetical protein
VSAPVSLGEVRQFLRLDDEADDALLSGLVMAATEVAEAWLGEPLAADWNAVPEGVRLGVLRLVASFHAARDGAAGAAPESVAACLMPWRRMRL